MNPPPALEISALEKRFPRFRLGPVDLTVPCGTIYGLIGPNGAGKTTLIDQIFGMGSPDSGSVRLRGFDHERDDVALKMCAAYVGPDLSFAAWGKIGKAIRFVRGFRPGWDDAYCSRLMQDFGLAMDDPIATLSFGNRTKLALLMALAWHPQVLILDEPTTGLDAQSRKILFAELLGMVKDEARTVLISSHQISDLERFADRLSVLHLGKIVAEGATSELVERHLQIEFTADNADTFKGMPGLFVQEHQGSRWRAVLDAAAFPLDALERRGAGDIRTQSVNLEDIFLALTTQLP